MWYKRIENIYLFIVTSFVTSKCLRFPKVCSLHGQLKVCADPGERLMLTPLIEASKIQKAKQKATVGKITDFGDVLSYSGYLTVKKDDNSSSFFWFFPAEEKPEEAPVLLWLQGGPGDTAMLGLFTENGPFEIGEGSKIKLREHRWTKSHSVLYIDNPIGTGFSVTDGELRTNQDQIADDLYEALKQFFTMFPQFKENDFIVSGESYGGKYATTISYKIHQENLNASTKINLKAIAISSGWVDPINQIIYSDYWYEAGLIDSVTAADYKDNESKMAKDISNGKWMDAIIKYIGEVNGLYEIGGINNNHNFLVTTNIEKELKELIEGFFNRSDVRAAVHVGNTKLNNGHDVFFTLAEDIPKTNAPKLLELLKHYRVLTFNGQIDIIVPYISTVNYLQKLEFEGSDQYKTAERKLWKVNGEVAGYVKQGGKLTEVLVRNAGHMIAYHQPEWAYDLIYKFARNLSIV